MALVLCFTIYFLIVIFLYRRKEHDLFSSNSNWVINAVSLFAVNTSFYSALLYSGVFIENGIQGLWLFWSFVLFTGLVPFVFAPLWSRLQFITDNQFILLRFSGFSAKVLHVFRAAYLGMIIIPILISFQLIMILKINDAVFQMKQSWLLVILVALLLLLTWKNSLKSNLKFDVFNASIVLIGLMISAIYLACQTDHQLNRDFSSAFPEHGAIYFFLVLQCISVSLFDGGGTESQRFIHLKSPQNAWKTAALYVFLSSLFSLLIAGILIMSDGLDQPSIEGDQELYILYYLRSETPEWLFVLILAGILGSFLSTFQGFLNWGGGLITKDLLQTYVLTDLSSKKEFFSGKIAMLSIALISALVTLYYDDLYSLITFFFSISAGVAPVFILRWFWYRMNAWSQLSAMLSSGFYTVLYSWFLNKLYFFDHLKSALSVNEYFIQLLFVTICTTITWLGVTFLTRADSDETINTFKHTLRLQSGYLKATIFKSLIFGMVMLFLFCLGLYFWMVVV